MAANYCIVSLVPIGHFYVHDNLVISGSGHGRERQGSGMAYIVGRGSFVDANFGISEA
jgi:hypothetical protein